MAQTDYKYKLLFICLGNICRSPAAEGVMKHIVESENAGSDFYIDSAGIGGWHVGELPDKRMRVHAARRGYNLNSRARQFTEDDFGRFDYIIVMDDDNYKNVSSRARTENERQKVLRMCNYFSNDIQMQSVPDPYYGGDRDFELALDLIENGCAGLFDSIRKNA